MTQHKNKRQGVRFKLLRNILDDLNSFRKGWGIRMGRPGRKIEGFEKWSRISDFPTRIKWRPELGEQNEARIRNMEICAEAIQGWILQPGATFSMRKAIGDPIPERGFQSGPIIVQGKLQEASGGGICQVSTAIFNAALLSGLEILEKHNHSSDIWGENRFIGLGRDAAFVYALKDLKLRNPHKKPVSLHLAVNRDDLILQCWVSAPWKPDFEIEVISEVLAEKLPTLPEGKIPPGKQIRKGWKVQTRRFEIRPQGKINTFQITETYKPLLQSIPQKKR